MALSHGLSISVPRLKELEGFFYRAGSLASVFAREKIDLSKRCRLPCPAFVFYFSPPNMREARLPSLSAGIPLDTLLLENKSEPRKVSLVPASSQD